MDNVELQNSKNKSKVIEFEVGERKYIELSITRNCGKVRVLNNRNKTVKMIGGVVTKEKVLVDKGIYKLKIETKREDCEVSVTY